MLEILKQLLRKYKRKKDDNSVITLIRDILRACDSIDGGKKIMLVLNQLNIDARDQSQTLIIQQEVRKDIDNFMQAVWQILTPKQQRQIQELAKEMERVK